LSVLLAWLRVALVDLRGDLRRFGVLLACLALGVATIAIVGSVGAALQSALDRDARQLLGGDMEAGLSYRFAEPAERQLLDSLGTVAEVVEIMGNAVVSDDNTAFLSMRAVDANYPLVGSVTITDPLTPGASLAELLAPQDGVWGAVADSLLLDRMGLAVGDTFTIEAATFQLRGVQSGVPDQITQGISIGIPAVISVDALKVTGLIEPGVLARFRYKLLLDDPAAFDASAASIRAAFPEAGWTVNSPQDATADLARFFDVFARFLTIVGLSALIVGGVGVSNAIAAYVTERQRSIATLKALGASSTRILVHFLTQVLLLTIVGIGLGLLLGGLITLVALPVLGDLLRIDLPPVIDIPSLLVASGFGLLVGFAFAFLPLKRAEALRPALLFRAAGTAVGGGGLHWRQLLQPGLIVPLAVAIALIYVLALVSTRRPELVLWYAVGVVVAFVVLRFSGLVLQWVLKLVPLPRYAAARNALKSIYRPGAPAPTVILSLGLGLALLLLIALIDNNLRHQLDRESIPDAPSFIFMDLFDDEVAAITDYTPTNPGIESFESNAMLRGAIESINGTPAADVGPVDEEFRSLLEAEIPLTAMTVLPPRSSVVSGEWWPADYDGPPLVSVFDEFANRLGLKVGDEMRFRIYGEEVVATIANLRNFVWRGGGVNFAFALTPNVLDQFPVSYLGFLKTVPGAEREVQRALVAEFPQTVFVPVAEALDVFARVLNSITNAIAMVGGLAVISGLLVLAGAMAAGRRQREADAVIMKVLGATRTDIVVAYLIEYGLLGGLAAVLAAILGLVGTWGFVEFALEIDFSVDPWVIIGVIVSAVILTIAVGVATTWSALSVKPSGFLREE
jgi:putative ABC transport system permease protein